MNEETNCCDIETASEKKSRLRVARELKEELREEERDKIYFQREMVRKNGRRNGSDIYLEYAKAILEKVLNSDKVNVLAFSQGTSEEGKRIRAQVCFSVSNMASELTKQHMSLYP